ncbi:FdtA/QdtA family cupin domain-containing protein [Echinicola sp. 20G]|uniref:sugar 3,4-ketoisomerase n=1 Tax=Echinicola sp. 20G TaxID=2781961 RepID=UPI001F186D73|nr:FdtA/QdtA family cupin domain-containing protein [Echinicola sp. 20G]
MITGTMVKPSVFKLGNVKSPLGNLNFWEQGTLPFEVKRAFWITEVPAGGERGIHAHKKDNQITVCLQGKVKVELEDLTGQHYVFELNDPGEALYLPCLVWSKFTFEENSILLVLSSQDFEESDYIRLKADFEKLKDGYSKAL